MHDKLSLMKRNGANEGGGKEILANVQKQELNTDAKNCYNSFRHQVALLNRRKRGGSDTWQCVRNPEGRAGTR